MLITSINVFLWSTSGTHVSFREHSINTSELESKVCPKPMHQLQPSPAPRPSPPPAPDSVVHRSSPHRPRTASSLEGKKWTQLLSALTHPTTSATTWTLTTSQPLAQISVSQPFKPRSSKQKSWPLLQAGVLSDHRQGGDLSCPCLTLLPPWRPSHPPTLSIHTLVIFSWAQNTFLIGPPPILPLHHRQKHKVTTCFNILRSSLLPMRSGQTPNLGSLVPERSGPCLPLKPPFVHPPLLLPPDQEQSHSPLTATKLRP